eukprot:scaffold412_cov388-Prasinococcus_capsulatus_cf.AAC.11
MEGSTPSPDQGSRGPTPGRVRPWITPYPILDPSPQARGHWQGPGVARCMQVRVTRRGWRSREPKPRGTARGAALA